MTYITQGMNNPQKMLVDMLKYSNMTPRLWDKIENFSGLHCLAIPRRDSHICKENQTKYTNM